MLLIVFILSLGSAEHRATLAAVNANDVFGIGGACEQPGRRGACADPTQRLAALGADGSGFHKLSHPSRRAHCVDNRIENQGSAKGPFMTYLLGGSLSSRVGTSAMSEAEDRERRNGDGPESRVLTQLELLRLLTDPGDVDTAHDPRPVDQHDQPYSAADLG